MMPFRYQNIVNEQLLLWLIIKIECFKEYIL